MIEAGKKEGAKLETGGKRIGSDGYFVEPTVFSNVQDNMTIATDEVSTGQSLLLKFRTVLILVMSRFLVQCNASLNSPTWMK